MTLGPGDVVEGISNGKFAIRKADGSLEVNSQRVEQSADHALTAKQAEALAKIHAAGERGLDLVDAKGRVTVNGNCFNALRNAGLADVRNTGETFLVRYRTSPRRSSPWTTSACPVRRMFLTAAGKAALGA